MQRWGRRHTARGQGHKKIRGQGLTTQRASALKKNVFEQNSQTLPKILGALKKKKGLPAENCNFFVKFQTKKKKIMNLAHF